MLYLWNCSHLYISKWEVILIQSIIYLGTIALQMDESRSIVMGAVHNKKWCVVLWYLSIIIWHKTDFARIVKVMFKSET